MYSPDHKHSREWCSKDMVVRYGAQANKYFMLFNIDLARAITSNGRYFIRTLGKYIEEGLQNLQKMDRPYVIYHDTDSVIGSTNINTSKGLSQIQDLYDNVPGTIETIGKDDYVKHVDDGIKCLSFNTATEKTEHKNIKYIMKHKVQKRMYKIETKLDNVVVTEDHSVIIKRNNKYIDIAAKNIKNNDIIILQNEQTKNFKITDLGVQEQYVYDIEVEDNHNFFGNNILVHNSCYFKIDNFVNKAFKDKLGSNIQEKTDFCDNFYKNIVDKFVQKTIDDVGAELNVFNKDVVGSEREIIASCLSPKTPIRVLKDDKVQTLSISSFAKSCGIDIRTKSEEIIDISDKNIFIPSYSNNIEPQKILNIQKKVTTKNMVELISPTGKSIVVTEDHKIAVKLENQIIYKEAKNIAEDDDVVYHDFGTTTKFNSEIFGKEYINPSSKRNNNDRISAGKKISRARLNGSRKRENELVNRITNIIKKGKYFYKLYLFLYITKKYSKSVIINFLKCNNLEKYFDISIIHHMVVNRDKVSKRLKYIKKKDWSLRPRSTRERIKTRFRIFCDRCKVHYDKNRRATKSTKLHTDKHRYRKEVKKYTENSVKNYNIKNIEKRDKYNWNLDHIVPIMYGFEHNIPPEIIGNHKNLQVISKCDNIKKGKKLPLNYNKELFKDYINERF